MRRIGVCQAYSTCVYTMSAEWVPWCELLRTTSLLYLNHQRYTASHTMGPYEGLTLHPTLGPERPRTYTTGLSPATSSASRRVRVGCVSVQDSSRIHDTDRSGPITQHAEGRDGCHVWISAALPVSMHAPLPIATTPAQDPHIEHRYVEGCS